jgi:2-hydroxychromene-2-carboxylate isomerase
LANTPQQQQAADKLSQWRKLRMPTFSKARGRTLEFFFSFRSPYSYIALQRVYKLAQHYQLKLKILPVLPMVMRGLAVPKAKRRYILLDAKREAANAGVPFGKIVDPVGAGVERCMALCGYAAKQGKLNDFIFNAATDIWSKGVDVSTDSGLKKVLAETQLDWQAAKPLLAKDSWRTWAEAHRAKMMEAGNWGVPSMRFDGRMFWGQDRLSALEQYLLTNYN